MEKLGKPPKLDITEFTSGRIPAEVKPVMTNKTTDEMAVNKTALINNALRRGPRAAFKALTKIPNISTYLFNKNATKGRRSRSPTKTQINETRHMT
jgi:hypothetical protein